MLLAGGRASRLGGVDKPGVEVGGRPLVEIVADAAADSRRLIVVGPRRPGLARATFVREDPAGAGPVPATAAGLRHVGALWVALLAADLPFLRRQHLAAVRAAAAGHRGAVLVDRTGREQWLIGIWLAEPLRKALDVYAGSSLRGLLAPLQPLRVSLPIPEGVPPPWLDCDTMDDITSAKEWM